MMAAVINDFLRKVVKFGFRPVQFWGLFQWLLMLHNIKVQDLSECYYNNLSDM